MLRLQCDRKLNLDSIIALASNNVIFENTAYKTSSSGLLFIHYRNSIQKKRQSIYFSHLWETKWSYNGKLICCICVLVFFSGKVTLAKWMYIINFLRSILDKLVVTKEARLLTFYFFFYISLIRCFKSWCFIWYIFLILFFR